MPTPAHDHPSSPTWTHAATVGLGLTTTLAAGAARVGRTILLGVGGFGWLTRYAHLQVPATLATAALLAFGFFRVHGRPHL